MSTGWHCFNLDAEVAGFLRYGIDAFHGCLDNLAMAERGVVINWEDVRYYLALSLAVFGCSGFYAAAIIYPFVTWLDLSVDAHMRVYAVAYVLLVCWAFPFYRKRLRGII